MSYHLIEPTACTPGAGWEKGQVENQVGVIRKQFFAPRPSFKTLEDLNAWLADVTLLSAISVSTTRPGTHLELTLSVRDVYSDLSVCCAVCCNSHGATNLQELKTSIISMT